MCARSRSARQSWLKTALAGINVPIRRPSRGSARGVMAAGRGCKEGTSGVAQTCLGGRLGFTTTSSFTLHHPYFADGERTPRLDRTSLSTSLLTPVSISSRPRRIPWSRFARRHARLIHTFSFLSFPRHLTRKWGSRTTWAFRFLDTWPFERPAFELVELRRWLLSSPPKRGVAPVRAMTRAHPQGEQRTCVPRHAPMKDLYIG